MRALVRGGVNRKRHPLNHALAPSLFRRHGDRFVRDPHRQAAAVLPPLRSLNAFFGRRLDVFLEQRCTRTQRRWADRRRLRARRLPYLQTRLFVIQMERAIRRYVVAEPPHSANDKSEHCLRGARAHG